MGQIPPKHDRPGAQPADTVQAVSILSPEEVQALGGLPREAVAGLLQPDPDDPNRIAPERFRPNPAFIELMHRVIKTYGPSDSGLIMAAAGQKDGWVYIVDLRTPEGPQGRVPPEDIIGAFAVREGQLVPNSYRPNENHRVFSEHGLVRLPPFLRAAFVHELKPVPPA